MHGGVDTSGAVRSVEKVAAGLRWERVAAPVTATGSVGRAAVEACRELGGTVAAHLLGCPRTFVQCLGDADVVGALRGEQHDRG